MESISLKNLFEKSKISLESNLRGKKLPQDYQQIQNMVKENFENLLTSDEFRVNLIDADIKLLNSIIRIYTLFNKTSILDSIDYEGLSKHTEQSISIKDNNTVEDSVKEFLYLVPTLVSAFIRPWLTIPVAIATIGYKHSRRNRAKNHNVNITSKEIDESFPITEELIAAIIDALDKLCEEIDDIINRAKHNRKEIRDHYEAILANCSLDKMYPQLLKSLQYIWKAKTENSPKFDQYVDMLISDFENYGFKIVELTEETRPYFIFKGNPKISQETMYLPAIVKYDEENGNKLIENGIVYIPKQ